MKKFIIFLGLCCSMGFSQKSINEYKYVLIPDKYEFLGEPDLYQLNSLTKFLFNKYGYQAYLMTDELPQDLQQNKCLGLIADVEKHSALLKNKLQIHLKDCNGVTVESSRIGETREKAYATAYNLALRDAFETFQNADYAYQPSTETIAVGKENKVETLPVPSADHKETKNLVETVNKEIQKDDIGESEEIKEMPAESIEPKPRFSPKTATEVLYAQPIPNGYQLVDTQPQKIMVLLHSGKEDVFLVQGKNAVVYKKEGIWFYATNDGDLVIKKLEIKF